MLDKVLDKRGPRNKSSVTSGGTCVHETSTLQDKVLDKLGSSNTLLDITVESSCGDSSARRLGDACPHGLLGPCPRGPIMATTAWHCGLVRQIGIPRRTGLHVGSPKGIGRPPPLLLPLLLLRPLLQ